MSDPHDHDGPHEGPIKTPKQLILAVVFSFLIPIFVIVLLVKFVGADPRPAAGSDGLGAEAVARRIQPVGRVEIRDTSAVAVLRTGEQVYTAQCSACHAAGLAGAPKLGDATAWAARIKTGYDALLTSALKGKGAMAAQGGGEYNDTEVGRAVVYIANKGGAKFDEPKVPVAAAAAAEPAAAIGTAPAPAATPATATAPVAAAAPAVVAAVTTAAPAAAGAVPALYTQVCAACHIAGVAGAPKLGDKAAWAPRLALGIDGLTASVIKGKNAMPARGGSAGTDAEIKAAVTYMVSTAK
jgi:cytochrome c5